MDTNYQASSAPVGQLKTNRSLLKVILLSIVTLGIYNLVFFSSISNDINVMATRYDGKKTMHYCILFFLVGPFTLEIGYWLWNILGACIIVGPFIYLHKLCTAMNLASEHYNIQG